MTDKTKCGAVVESLPYSASDPGPILTMGAVCTVFVNSPYGHVGFLWVLEFPPTLQKDRGL